MNQTADVIVIGGGIMGTSAAFQLADRGLRVTLVEKGHLAGGTTGRSSAIIRQHYSNEITARMALYSLHVFQDFPKVVGGDCGYRRTGFVVLASRDERKGLEANVALQLSVGIDTRLLDPDDLRGLTPGMEGVEEVFAAYEPDGGYADPSATVNAFGEAARRKGAAILQDTEVVDVSMDHGRVQGVVTSRGEIAAGAVVNTAGPWAGRIARRVGVDLPIHPCRVQVAFFAPPRDGTPAPLVFADFPNVTYFRPETGDLTLIGSLDPAEGKVHADPDQFRESVDPDFILDMGERLTRRFSSMERGHSRGGYASIYDVTPDWHAVIDEVPRGSGFFIAAGHSGHGFKLGPAVGVMVADLVTDGSTPGLDPRPFRLARFEEGQPIRGSFDYSIAG